MTDATSEPSSATIERGPLIVGVDESQTARAALRWALAEAIVRHAPLTALAATGPPFTFSPLGWGGAVVDPAVFVESARKQVERTVDEVLAELPHPHPQVDRVATAGSAAEVLVAASATAALLVVGTRLLHGVTRWLGSVSDQVVRHAASPVALIPETEAAMIPDAPLVVGVDGSPNSLAALRWAVAEAAIRSVLVRAVMVWSFLDQHRASDDPEFNPQYGETEALDALRQLVGKAIGPEAADAVQLEAVCDLPTAGLLTMAEQLQTSLIVVGARGVGGFHGLLLGSACSKLLVETSRPVVVIRDTRN